MPKTATGKGDNGVGKNWKEDTYMVTLGDENNKNTIKRERLTK